MSGITLQLPGKVSPLIKAARWSLLLSGVFYGILHKKYLSGYDKPLKILRKKHSEERIIEEKKMSSKEFTAFIKDMAPFFNVDLPEDFESPK